MNAGKAIGPAKIDGFEGLQKGKEKIKIFHRIRAEKWKRKVSVKMKKEDLRYQAVVVPAQQGKGGLERREEKVFVRS